MGLTKEAYVLARPRGPHILRNYCIETPLPPVTPAPRKTVPRLCPLTLWYGVYLYLTAPSCQHSRTIVSRLYRTSHATTRGASHRFVSETTSLTYGPQWPKCIRHDDIGRQVQLPALQLHIREILGLNPETGYPTPSVRSSLRRGLYRLDPAKATHAGKVLLAVPEKHRYAVPSG